MSNLMDTSWKDIKFLYCIEYLKDDPIVITLPIQNVYGKIVVSYKQYTFQVVFPNGDIRYITFSPKYVNNDGEHVGQTIKHTFSKYKEWNVNNSLDEDMKEYYINTDRQQLINDYIKYLQTENDKNLENVKHFQYLYMKYSNIINYLTKEI